jgi:GntR family transcriptional regulator
MAVPHAYQNVLDALTRDIQNGTYQPGDPIPPVRELAEQHRVSPSTARQATAELQRMGLVWSGYRDGRRGIFVRSQGRTDFYATDALRLGRLGSGSDAFTENALKVGRDPSIDFTMVMRVPPQDVAARLGLDVDEIVVERTSLQRLDGEPWSRERSWYPMDLAREVGLDTPHTIEQGTLRLLAESGYQETAFRDETTDEPADVEAANDLAVIPGAPLLVQTRTAATDTRVTRVTRTVRHGGRNRLIWETGSDTGIQVIRDQIRKGRP